MGGKISLEEEKEIRTKKKVILSENIPIILLPLFLFIYSLSSYLLSQFIL